MEKVSLPIKTKIAAWWTLIVSGLLTAWGVFLILPPFSSFTKFLIFLVLFSLFSFISTIFFLKTKKQNWWYVMIISLGFIIISILVVSWPLWGGEDIPFANLVTLMLYAPPFLVPLILFFLDRKNFWKIAT